MLKSTFPECENPEEFLIKLNKMLLSDQIPGGLLFNMLLFTPEKDTFSYFSSYGALWRFREGKRIAELITSRPVALGKEDNPTFELTVSEWRTGDTLLLFVPSLHEEEDFEASKAFVKEHIEENLKLPLKDLVSSVLNKIKRTSQNFKSQNCFIAGFLRK